MTSFRYGYWLVFVNVTQIRATGEDRISTEELSPSKENKGHQCPYIFDVVLLAFYLKTLKIPCLVIFFQKIYDYKRYFICFSGG